MSYIIGVDAGGTKTEITAYDSTGKELKTVIKGSGNFVENFEDALMVIIEGIKDVKMSIEKNERCKHIVVGAAGINASGKGRIISQRLKECFSVKVTLIGDGELAHYAILQGEDGDLVIAGTGSVIINKYKGIWKRYGGWGPILGDEGSGYKLGISLIKNCLMEFDLNKSQSEISKSVLEHLNCDDIMKLPSIIKTLTKSEIANVTKVLLSHDDSDPLAIKIIKREAEGLAEEYITFHKTFFKDNNANIGLNGGIIINNDTFREAFLNKITSSNFILKVKMPQNKISKGAYYFDLLQ
ncbi:hypothetical protein OL233_01405 [Vagococcus sp. PNs007]|uniref:ATPase BadF/BadG/BcrA/BcrD type domain-containing protein n=1 Tax=Vagococcus proximus TaxID=2991417 RepID=A0ABT5WYV0_9ENTE|nr:BadF/BadG/BcrA/BcrD ATPase family protein [Vagococcus proximus]MDF0478930.1 hypothetical protein [Vagococcus proximus]